MDCEELRRGTSLAVVGDMRLATLVLLGIFVAGPAFAAPLVRNGSSVRVVLPEGRKAASAIRPNGGAADGWTLRLSVRSGSVNLVDVTAGATALKYVYTLDGESNDIVLDSDRFIAGHAYRVELRDPQGGVQTSIVYLVAPKGNARSNVAFTGSGADDCAGDSDGIAIRDKGTL